MIKLDFRSHQGILPYAVAENSSSLDAGMLLPRSVVKDIHLSLPLCVFFHFAFAFHCRSQVGERRFEMPRQTKCVLAVFGAYCSNSQAFCRVCDSSFLSGCWYGQKLQKRHFRVVIKSEAIAASSAEAARADDLIRHSRFDFCASFGLASSQKENWKPDTLED